MVAQLFPTDSIATQGEALGEIWQVLFKKSLLFISGDIDSRILLKEDKAVRRRVPLKKGLLGEKPERFVRDYLHLALVKRKDALGRDGQSVEKRAAFSRPLHLQLDARQLRANLQWSFERIFVRAEKERAARKQCEQ